MPINVATRESDGLILSINEAEFNGLGKAYVVKQLPSSLVESFGADYRLYRVESLESGQVNVSRLTPEEAIEEERQKAIDALEISMSYLLELDLLLSELMLGFK